MPTFRFSPHMAMRVKGLEAATRFYSQVLGMDPLPDEDREKVLRLGEIHFHLSEGSEQDVWYEFVTDDLVGARSTLSEAGCQVVDSHCEVGGERRPSLLVQDPYGLRYHVFEAT